MIRRVAGAPPRRAFTLLELLLVLGVLVILSGMAWPVLDRLLTSERLAKSADRVRASWVSARASAIESGRILAFRYEPDGTRYRLALQEEVDEFEERRPPSLAKLPLEQTLPSGVRFLASQDNQATPGNPADPAALDPETSREPTAPDNLDQADANLSAPILFFPDGTCSSARVTLRNDSGWRVEIQLRGMTGVVTASRPQRSEELTP